MTLNDFQKLIQDIVAQAQALSKKHTDQGKAPVNYACVFAQSESEYDELLQLARQTGTVVQETATGLVFKIAPLATTAGELELLKIRRPDPQRTELGDADFTVSDYQKFKAAYLKESAFNLIERKNMEMVELVDPSFNVRTYYSHPPLAKVLELHKNIPS